jgi:predicted transcriptional regulator
MKTPKVFDSEYRFCLILWENEPINSTELVKLCKGKLGWSKATTYTVVKRLTERGVVKNEKATVTSLVSKAEVQAAEIEELVEKTFEGSLPAFVASFTKCKGLSSDEVAEIRKMIDSYGEG